MVTVWVGCSVTFAFTVGTAGECADGVREESVLVWVLLQPAASKKILVSKKTMERIEECGVRMGL